MTSILSSGSVDISIKARELSMMVPHELLQRIRSRDNSTTQAEVDVALNNIGVDHIYEMMAYKTFKVEIANALGMPVLYLERWLRSHPDHDENEEIVNEYAAQIYLNNANDIIRDIKDGDVEVARTSKVKADHLVKIAEKIAPAKYDKQSKGSVINGASFTLNINPGYDFTKSRVIESA